MIYNKGMCASIDAEVWAIAPLSKKMITIYNNINISAKYIA
jgi:hypothetical protein